MLYWVCGKVNAGKTTFSYKLKKELGDNVVLLDGDSIRHVTNNNDYSKEGIFLVHTHIIGLACYFEEQGLNVIVAIVSPYKDIRKATLDGINHILYYVHGGKMVNGIPFEEPLKEENPIIIPDWKMEVWQRGNVPDC